MAMLPTSRELSIRAKSPSHYLVKYTLCRTYQVRTRAFFRCEGKIQQMSIYEVQYGTKRQHASAVVIGSGTEVEMNRLKAEREAQTPTSSPPRSPTPPPQPPAESATSPSMPDISRPAKRKKKQATTAAKKQPKPPAQVLSRGAPPTTPPPTVIVTVSLTPKSANRPTTPVRPSTPVLSPPTRPSVSDSPEASASAISQQPPRPTIFPDDNKIFHLFDVLIKGVTKLTEKVTNIDGRLRTLEAKTDLVIDHLHQQRPETPWSVPRELDAEDTAVDETIPQDLTVPSERLKTLKERSASAGNFAALVIKELLPHLFGPDNLRQRYNWNGGGINGKRELSPRVKQVVRNYTAHYYPECHREDYFRDVVVQKVNEHLRRPAVKACRRRLVIQD